MRHLALAVIGRAQIDYAFGPNKTYPKNFRKIYYDAKRFLFNNKSGMRELINSLGFRGDYVDKIRKQARNIRECVKRNKHIYLYDDIELGGFMAFNQNNQEVSEFSRMCVATNKKLSHRRKTLNDRSGCARRR